MIKVKFLYQKENEEQTSERVLLRPEYLIRTHHKTKIDGNQWKYVRGHELDAALSEDVKRKYEQAINMYYKLRFPTLETFLKDNFLDPSLVKLKSFKRDCMSRYEESEPNGEFINWVEEYFK